MDTPVPHFSEDVDKTRHHLAEKILHALQEIRFGSVEIIIHDSKVVQIERREKIRIDTNSSRATSRVG